MNIKHETVNFNGIDKIYIYVEVADESEFGEEFLHPDENSSFLNKLKHYVTQKVNFKKDDIAVLIINGVLIGVISLSVFTNAAENHIKENAGLPNQTNYEVAVDYLNKENQDKSKAVEVQKTVIESETPTSAVTPAVVTPTTTPVTLTPVATTTTNTTPTPAPIPTTTTTTTKTAAPTVTQAPLATTNTNTSTTTVATGTTIKLSTNGTVVTMNLEDYVVGVVASEMPASFNLEALKAQAIVARTFAMKKTSEGVTLLNSTAHQIYKTESQCKQMWGTSFTTYYNKIKSVVSSTKGMVLTYNGKYIDALYHAISNSKTELPKYIWGSNLPYLQSVSSNWDVNVKGFEVSTNITYATLSSKLGKTINANTEFKVLSETVSGRVESIKIGDTTYSGVKLRSLLGLRSTDFKVVKGATSVTVTTRGYGHGVGMSQNGANEAAKEGYSYEQILKHYYTGVSIVKK